MGKGNDGEAAQPAAPNQRTFSLNSREFYEAVCEPRERPWIVNGSLAREPRGREREVLRAQDV